MAQQKAPSKKTKTASRTGTAPRKTKPAAVAAAAPAKAARVKVDPKAKAPPPRKPAKLKVERKAPPMSKPDLQYFRGLLLEKRREILGDVGSMESEAFKSGSNLSNMPIHMADVGTDNFEQEFTLGLIESERQILREIQEALARIDDGSYGVCQGTGKAIPRVRLEAVPWAKYTIEYSRLLEQGKVGRDEEAGEEEESSGSAAEEDEE